VLKSILKELGFEEERVKIRWVSASEGQRFADTIKEMVEDLKRLGPNPMQNYWSI
jgi:F420-non-reducing hydrogenase iron-sulfur subunit